MDTIIAIIIAIPLSILFLWKLLGNCVNDSYKEWLTEKGDDYVA